MSFRNGLPLFGLVAVGALLCIGTPLYVWRTTVGDQDSEAGMTAAASAYLDAWRDGQVDRAGEWTCERDEPETSHPLPDVARDDLAGYGPIEATVHRNSETPTLYSVDVELTFGDGTRRPTIFWMTEEDDGWRVCTMVR